MMIILWSSCCISSTCRKPLLQVPTAESSGCLLRSMAPHTSHYLRTPPGQTSCPLEDPTFWTSRPTQINVKRWVNTKQDYMFESECRKRIMVAYSLRSLLQCQILSAFNLGIKKLHVPRGGHLQHLLRESLCGWRWRLNLLVKLKSSEDSSSTHRRSRFQLHQIKASVSMQIVTYSQYA